MDVTVKNDSLTVDVFSLTTRFGQGLGVSYGATGALSSIPVRAVDQQWMMKGTLTFHQLDGFRFELDGASVIANVLTENELSVS